MDDIMAKCAVCGIIYRYGKMINGKVSHGYCDKHYREEMEKIKKMEEENAEQDR